VTARQIKDAVDVRPSVANGTINAAYRGKADSQVVAALARNIHRIAWGKMERDTPE
jgi:hypothetical protein